MVYWKFILLKVLLQVAGLFSFHDLIDVCNIVYPKFTEDDTRTTKKPIPKNVALFDVAIWKEKNMGEYQNIEIFVTTPRIKPGTPATLSTIATDNNGNCILNPYPSWSANELNCKGLVSVYAVETDFCGRLWVLDSGVINQGTNNPKRLCRPKLLVFDLHTDALQGNYKLPLSVLHSESLLVNFVVDIRENKCEDAFIYIADAAAFKLIVFDYHQLVFWKFHSRFFYPYPMEGKMEINYVSFSVMFGITGMALGPVTSKGDRILFFHSLASTKESWVKTSYIRNLQNANASSEVMDKNFKVSISSRSSQSAAETITSSGVLILGILGNNSLACGSILAPTRPLQLVEFMKNSIKLQFTSSLKLYDGDDLWILSSSFQKYITNRLDENEYNYRIMRVSIEPLIRESKCNQQPQKTKRKKIKTP